MSEQLIKEMADAMVTSGMRDAGYEYVIIDDCWQISRARDGTILADPIRFPNGIAALANYVHARELKLGIYTDAGSFTCQGRPGSLGFEQQDVETYADWGVDYVKVDWCYSSGLDARTQYALWRDILAGIDRPIVLSICNWGLDSPWTWGRDKGNLWRTTYDIEDNWNRVLEIVDTNVHLAAYAAPGGWNDPDMLEVGNGGMTLEEYRSHFSLWAIMAAPLIAGNDLRIMSAATLAILNNPEVIAINQDPAGVQGARVYSSGGIEVWSKPLMAQGERAVLLFNRNGAAADVSVDWNDIGLAPGDAAVRDLWAQTELGVFANSFTAQVPAHGVLLATIVGNSPAISAPGQHYLSDLTWEFALSGWGPVERDSSNGGPAAGDGGTITIDGTPYSKGLGMSAAGRIRYLPAGNCSAFMADIGVDDAVGPHGSVVFEVWADGSKRFESDVMTGDSGGKRVLLDITGTSTLDLVLTDAGDYNSLDRADWAKARIICGSDFHTAFLPLVRQG